MKLKKRCKKKIREIQEMIQELPATPEVFTYVRIYQSLQELYYQDKYEILDNICNALLRR